MCAAWGAIRATLTLSGIGVIEVSPQRWKRAARLGTDKDASRAAARQRWPHAADRFARKRDDGRAEAALIALMRTEGRL